MASIYLRGEMYWILYRENGKNIQKSLNTKDKTVAKFKKNEIENKLALGESPLPSDVSLNDMRETYAQDSKHRKAQKTISDDDQRLSAFFSTCGLTRITQIKESVLSDYIKRRLDKDEINPTTANHTIKTVKAFLNFSVRRGMISKNPLATMKRYRVENKPPRYLSKAEIKTVLESCADTTLYPMVMIALYTGVRYGELSRISWSDVNLRNNTITIPRSKAGRFRTIPIHRDLMPILRPETFPFKQMSSPVAIRALQGTTRMNGIGWHTLRHTFASHLVMSGVDIVTVSKLLGHSRLETTMIYAHLSQGHIVESIQKLAF